MYKYVGDTQVKFEYINGEWYMSSLELAKVFGKSNHGDMVINMKSKTIVWRTYMASDNILKSSYEDTNNKTHTSCLFDLTALEYFTTNMHNATKNKHNMMCLIHSMQNRKTSSKGSNFK